MIGLRSCGVVLHHRPLPCCWSRCHADSSNSPCRNKASAKAMIGLRSCGVVLHHRPLPCCDDHLLLLGCAHVVSCYTTDRFHVVMIICCCCRLNVAGLLP